MDRLVYDGGIEIICGPMFSGKTEELLRRLNRFRYAKIPFIVFKHISDNREFDESYLLKKDTNESKKREHLASRDGKIIFENVFKVKDSQALFETVQKIAKENGTIRVVAIDEAQFFDLGLVNVVNVLANLGFHIIIAGLDMTYTGEPFLVMGQLLCISTEIKKLTAICTVCHNPAYFSQLVIDSNNHDVNQPLIGNTEYEARCRKHFHKPKK